MSTLATARRAAPGQPRQAAWTRSGLLGMGPDAALGLALAGALLLVAFVTTGGVDLPRNTWTEIVITVLGAGLIAAVVLTGGLSGSAAGRRWDLIALALFAGLAALTYCSIAWSVQPATSWVEANRTLSYLLAFAGGMALVRLAPSRWRALVGALAAVTAGLSAWALFVKVFPATFGPTDPLGRLHAPFDYWNATGLIAAMGLPAWAWLGGRREGMVALRAISAPATAILVAVLILSYSRGALLAGVVGLGLWLAVVPLRLRTVAMLALGTIGGTAITLWALSTHAITHDHSSLQARASAGHAFGLVLLIALALTAIAGFAAAFITDRVSLSAQSRRRIGIALLVCVAMLPLGGLGALAASSRGLTGEVSHVWSTLTNPNSHVSDNPGRLAELGSSRPRYWKEGLEVGEHALLKGVGAAGYATARTRYGNDPLITQTAHSYLIQTFADFGLIGVGVSFGLLIAWALAVRRALLPPGVRLLQPSAAGASERAGLLTLTAIVVVFGLHSLIDWTWFVPGTALPALVCAGWLAGRGALADRERAPRPHPLDSPARLAVVTAIAALTIAAGWFSWQPLRSQDADNAALTAFIRGDTPDALSKAHAAAAEDPVSVDPLYELSAIYAGIGLAAEARGELARATSLQPANAATWLALGTFDLRHRYSRAAFKELALALRLDFSNSQIHTLLDQAEGQLASH